MALGDDQRSWQNSIRSGIQGANSRPDPRAGNIQLGQTAMLDNGRQDQFRNQELGLANQLNAVATGQQRGAGELAVGRQVNNALGQAYGAATMARGNSGAGGARSAARAAGSIGLGGAGMVQQAAMSDQQGARAQLAQVLGQGRSADIGVAGQNAGAQNATMLQQGQMNQQTSMQNLESQLRARGMNDQAIQEYLRQQAQDNQYRQTRDDARNPTGWQIAGGIANGLGQIAGSLG